MNALIILFDAVAYSVGLLNLYLLILLYIRDRDTMFAREFLLMLAFSAIVVTQSLMAGNGGSLPTWFNPAGKILAYTGVSLLIFALPWYINHLQPVNHSELKNRLFLILAILTLLMNLISSILAATDGLNIRDKVNTISIALCIATTIYTIGLGIVARIIHFLRQKKAEMPTRQPINETTQTAIRMGLFTLLLLPAMIYLDFADLPVPGWPMLKGIHIVPMIYILWSILLMNLRSRTLLAILPGPAGYTQDTVNQVSAQYQLSPREREVMDLLIQGRTYDQIADTLCISLSTAKTHIGRIYRKTRVTNKVELIHILQKSTEKLTVAEPKSAV